MKQHSKVVLDFQVFSPLKFESLPQLPGLSAPRCSCESCGRQVHWQPLTTGGLHLEVLSLIDRASDLQSAIRVTVLLISMFELLGPSSWVSKTHTQPNYQTKIMMWIVCFCLRVEFLLKTDSGYPRDAGVFFHSRWQTLGVFCFCKRILWFRWVRILQQTVESTRFPVSGNTTRQHFFWFLAK